MIDIKIKLKEMSKESNELTLSNQSVIMTEKALSDAEKLIKSKLLPDAIKTPEQAVVIMQKGKELGFQPLQAFDSIDVILGKATLKPKAKGALARKTGKVWWRTVKDWEPIFDENGELIDYETVLQGFRNYDGHITEDICKYTYSEAASMGLVGKDNWKRQPKIMAYWRCLSRLLDRIAPDLTGGLYMSDEMADVAGIDYKLSEEGDFTVVE